MALAAFRSATLGGAMPFQQRESGSLAYPAVAGQPGPDELYDAGLPVAWQPVRPHMFPCTPGFPNVEFHDEADGTGFFGPQETVDMSEFGQQTHRMSAFSYFNGDTRQVIDASSIAGMRGALNVLNPDEARVQAVPAVSLREMMTDYLPVLRQRFGRSDKQLYVYLYTCMPPPGPEQAYYEAAMASRAPPRPGVSPEEAAYEDPRLNQSYITFSCNGIPLIPDYGWSQRPQGGGKKRRRTRRHRTKRHQKKRKRTNRRRN